VLVGPSRKIAVSTHGPLGRSRFKKSTATFLPGTAAPQVKPEGILTEPITQLIIGHARTSLTYGHYSKGERVTLREHINKLRYPADIMRLIRGVSNRKRP
jgi:hypothetical protein